VSEDADVEFIGYGEPVTMTLPQDMLRMDMTVQQRVYGLLDLCITRDGVTALYAYIEDAT
jgi:hypothetical protein